MTPELWEQVLQILEQVRAAPAGDRSQLVASLCRDSDELRVEVERMLELDASSRGAFDEPLLGTEFDLGLTTREALSGDSAHEMTGGAWQADVGTTIGQYTVVRRIGSGGMGIVYEAQQHSPSRSVALKICAVPPRAG